jgi:DUF1680 family protein
MEVLSRRTLLQAGTTVALMARLGGAAAGEPGRTLWQPAAYGDVELLEGPLLEQFQRQHKALLAMDDDALLKPFRAAAGIAAPGPDLGGWYNAVPGVEPPADFHGFIPGHSFGQYVSGMARAYAITGDPVTRAKIHRLIDGFAPTVGSRFYDDYRLPAYTYDKIAIGLLDAYSFAGKSDALRVLNRAVDAALPHLPEKALTRPEMEARPHKSIAYTWDEPYTLPENFYLAFNRGAGRRFRVLADRFLLDKEYFDPLARGENVLPGKHAYSHMNALSSAMQAYITTGSAKHLQAAKNGFDLIVAQSFATGGWGPNEAFVMPGSGALGDSLGSTHASFETPCGCYGHFKAGRYLISVTGDSHYGDSMERVLYNAVLGVLPMKPDGTAFYYSDYNTTGTKFYHEHTCTCCSGTLGQVVADYGISSYFTSGNAVAINLYVPSRFRWKRAGGNVVLRQTTNYPLASDVEIEVQTPGAETFAILLRIPAWAGGGTRVSVNGKTFAASVPPGRFFEVSRPWRNGDRVTLSFDMPLRLLPVDEKHPTLVAVARGPLALFATGDRFLPMRREELLKLSQTGPNAVEWRVRTGDGVQVFKPFFAIGHEATRLYQPIPS